MDGTETITQQIFGIKSFYLFELLRQVPLGGVVAKYMSNDLPYSVTT